MGLFSSDTLAPFKDEFGGYLAEFDALSTQDAGRLERFRCYRQEIEATRLTDLDRSVGEVDYGNRASRADMEMERHRFRLPLAQALTVKHAYRIAGRLPDATVDRREESPQERHRSDVMEKMWWAIVRASNGEAQFSSAAWDGSQIGAGCFEVYYDVGSGMPRFRAVDPGSILVVKGVDDPHDFDRVFRFWSAPVATVQNDYRDKEFRGVKIPVERIVANDSVAQTVTIVQVGTKTNYVRFVVCDNGRHAIPLLEFTHNYGFVNYVVIPNLGPESRVWGWADYEFVREIARYIPVALGREADVIKMTANGAYTSTGTGQASSAVRRVLAAGGVLSIKKDGAVKPVDPPQIPAFASEHGDKALELFRMLGFAPGAAWGEGGAQSGSDRGLQLGPLLELTGLKQVNWGGGLSRIAAMALKMVELKSTGTTRYHGVAQRGFKREPFGFNVGESQTASVPVTDDDGFDQTVDLPMDPKSIFDGEYRIRFNWLARLDQDDPAYVASELNKFAQGTQALRTTLERLGFDSPEDEIKLIEQEAQDHPWLRNGMLKLLEMQFAQSQQGQGGGQPFDPTAAIDDASATMSGPGGGDSGALNADALSGSLDGGVSTLYGAG